MNISCVLVAAGRGTRLGANRPKALVACHGKTILEHALNGVAAVPQITHIVVVCPETHKSEFDQIITTAQNKQALPQLTIVPGGPSRQSSVLRGLQAITANPHDPVLIHDAARCGTPPEIFTAVATAVANGAPAVVPVLPMADSLRNTHGKIVPRETIRAVQTPQGFPNHIIGQAHAQAATHAGSEATAASDDATLVENLGHPVTMVPGSPLSRKVTTPDDLVILAHLLEQQL